MSDTVALARWLMEHDPAKSRIVIESAGVDLVMRAEGGGGVVDELVLCRAYDDGYTSWRSLTECLFAAAHAYASRRPL